MEHNVRVLPPEVAVEELLALLEQTEPIPLVVSGNSMFPFLAHGRDTVFLEKGKGPLKRGDVILYRRASGQYVLHRIQEAGQTLTLLGDAQTAPEPGIRREQVLARAAAVRRKGKLLRPGDKTWDFFEKVWPRVVRLRPRLIGLYRKFEKMEK